MNRNKRKMALIVPIMMFCAACSEVDPAPENPVGGSPEKTTCPTDSARPIEKEVASTDVSMLNLDVVIRDFQQNHSDFENFSEETIEHLDDIYNSVAATGAAMNKYGFDEDWYAATAYHSSCGNVYSFEKNGTGIQIGVDGLPMQKNPVLPEYLQQVSAGPVLEYGECMYSDSGDYGRHFRGYRNALENVNGYKCIQEKTTWMNPVIFTPGMVAPHLQFTKVSDDGTIDMYDGVVIQKLSERCDNKNFDQWFVDVPTVNKRVNTALDIPRSLKETQNSFTYNFDSNNGGFFPLDSVNPTTREWVMTKPCISSIQPNGSCEIIEPQSLSIFCPPYKYQFASTQQDLYGQSTAKLCADWLNAGGPRAVNSDGTGNSAALVAAAANGKLGLQHLRNYGFTMMGNMSFKYDASKQNPEEVKFVSSGDLWVFVDGVLVIDLGGTHLPAPGSVNIQTLAKNNHGCHAGEPLAMYSNCEGASDATGWADGSVHYMHIFVANRQTEISDFSMELPDFFGVNIDVPNKSGKDDENCAN